MQSSKLRQAIQHAIDVPTILEASYFGAAEPSTGIIAPGLAGNRAEGMVAPQADIEKAVMKNMQEAQRRRETEAQQAENRQEETQGTHQVQRMVQPKPMQGMLNQEMAEAAAKKYNKDKKRIQKGSIRETSSGR